MLTFLTMFKVRVSTLPEAGLDLNEKLTVESVNNRLSEAPDSQTNKIEFAEPIHAKLHLEKVPHGMTAEGSVTAICSQSCSRCAEFVPHSVNCEVKHVFKHFSDPEAPLPEEDIGVNYYRGEHVELGSALEDMLILSLSPYWHPEDDAEGKCSHCKLDYKEKKKPIKLGTQGLGEALKKAGIK